MNGLFSFWQKALRRAFKESWEWFDHLNNFFTIIAAILYITFIAQWIAKAGIGQRLSLWIISLPVEIGAVSFLYRLFLKTPHEMYRDSLRQAEETQRMHQVVINELSEKLSILSDQRANLEIIFEPKHPMVSAVGGDKAPSLNAMTLLCVFVRNTSSQCAEGVELRLESLLPNDLGDMVLPTSLHTIEPSDIRKLDAVKDIYPQCEELWGVLYYFSPQNRNINFVSTKIAYIPHQKQHDEYQIVISARARNADKKEARFHFRWMAEGVAEFTRLS